MGKSQKDVCPFSYCRSKRGKFRTDAKRTYVWEKVKGTCVLLAIGEQEGQIQNAQVLSISSKSGDQKKVICRSTRLAFNKILQILTSIE